MGINDGDKAHIAKLLAAKEGGKEAKKVPSTVSCKTCGAKLRNSSNLMRHNHFTHGF